MACPCGSGHEFATCCGPILSGAQPAATAEALMRSRYSAYVRQNVAYLIDSHDPDTRDVIDEPGLRKWAARSEWLGLQIVATEAGAATDAGGQVEFVARFRDDRGVEHRHHERSQFVRRDGRWYFHDGEVQREPPVARSAPKIGRNDPCPCGSGKKYKKCCGARAPGSKQE